LKVSLIRKALHGLPKTLDDTYSRLFLEIDDAYREDAMKALLWLAFSDRPLLLAELAEAIVVRPLSHPPFDPEERFPDPESVLQILSSLVSVNDAGRDRLWRMGTVTLAHFSVKEYLISDRIRKGPAQYFAISSHIAHYFIAECCLLYVLHYANTATKTGSLGNLAAFPLITYASASWFTHINMLPVEQQKPLTPLALKLLLSADALSSWQLIRLGHLIPFPDEGALYYASSLGLLDVIKELLAAGWDPNEWENRSPLHVAAIECHAVAAFLLLSHRANVNAKDYMGYTPLHHAAEKGNMTITKLLFQFGARASPRHDQVMTPLHLAAFHSHEQIAGFLVERGAEVEVATIHDLRTPFHLAAWNDLRPLIELFLKQGANINAQNWDGETALHYAARDNQKILQDLLDHGADLEVETHCGETPLYWAAEGEQREATEKLVKAGARIALPLLLLAKEEYPVAHSAQFHLLLDVGMAANEETASLTLLALQECARLGYTLCGECQRILSEVSGGSTIQQILPIRNLVENLEPPD
jgi:ankyrin repeat domain-containing protein 50